MHLQVKLHHLTLMSWLVWSPVSTIYQQSYKIYKHIIHKPSGLKSCLYLLGISHCCDGEKAFQRFHWVFVLAVIEGFLWKFKLGGAGINSLLNVCNSLLINKICSDIDHFICWWFKNFTKIQALSASQFCIAVRQGLETLLSFFSIWTHL